VAGATTNYFLDGTSSLTANFATSSFASALTIAARDTATNAVTNLAPINYAGTINGSTFSTSGDDMVGRFYGPNAAEFGAVFSKRVNDPTIGTVDLIGVTVGKRP
jgi:hypothetical protein